jgi:phosphoglycerate dehydrogenase-like enzyme
VARRLAPVLTALGAKVVAFARRPAEDGTALLPLDELLHRSDIVSLHLPVNDETRNLLDARRIGLMKPGAILVNTARGGLVDQSALVEALRDARIAAAGLDVFAAEPPLADDPLLALPNVVATPHVAWLTGETLRRSLEIVVENARRLAAGEPLLHRVA